ncbi:YlmC/YmxH family sporulation protein [Jeotgalibacillus haloalkalitolerans]|uniref:YlmC/YmxH family sporulation protein n=1 Tax=Jeotgalibacillus haloalkalitolerans TaxID=3104292 RepID=A0ABU5KKH7_9BACL|nr:YlmC/YmxH family sporulation protein [Jeotgalibacillus sp. HH7-29]MDZ5711770.1 YlmC/YmxH family sporulation protein [Jeotgalibacillus sp. HH7-29]
MRMSELYRKEMINIDQAERMGILGNADVEFNDETGEIINILVPAGKTNPFNRSKDEYAIPWKSVHAVGKELILIKGKQSQVEQQLHNIPENKEE